MYAQERRLTLRKWGKHFDVVLRAVREVKSTPLTKDSAKTMERQEGLNVWALICRNWHIENTYFMVYDRSRKMGNQCHDKLLVKIKLLGKISEPIIAVWRSVTSKAMITRQNQGMIYIGNLNLRQQLAMNCVACHIASV
ncbi:uncharacterized protein MELLADRAFT_112597 [Melampsora larici-populina 98AG31]|uniref:Uncharacterized protein n=1 Tax=Melampsora larici-populina (strain 98AG31 / pathotype 3-4-7) TaxID=747676 RepID=F4S6Z9_MELLP|nr:uncharacterized protein MELLADRAFT_112597 [Melampsora larici-populina 98AG31]EGF99592.1 hypothetical protein MELLADRAFT_112597 [Melampsora larici-populina 98AG31]